MKYLYFIKDNIPIISIGIIIAVLLLISVYSLYKMHKTRLQRDHLAFYNEQQMEYFMHMQQTEENTKKFRHDILNHLLQLQAYCSHKEYDKLSAYLEEIIGTAETLQEIKYSTGNEIVDVMLNHYLLPLDSTCNIHLESKLQQNIFISQTDLCIIISNLLKNAAEAVTNAKEKAISIQILQGENSLIIDMKNTYGSTPKTTASGSILSTKPDKKHHGYGLKNVKETVKKYHGIIDMEIMKEDFRVKIYLSDNRLKH